MLRLRHRFATSLLSRADPGAMAPGRVEIDGDRLFAIVSKGPGRGRKEARLEIHASYIDIQYVVSGIDMMGWKPVSTCREPTGPFDPDKEVGFFADNPDVKVAVDPVS